MVQNESRLIGASAMIVLAGIAGGLVSLEAVASGQVSALRSAEGTSLSFNGSIFHTVPHPPGTVANKRVHRFDGSPTVMVSWEEPGRAEGTGHFAISRTGDRIDQVARTEHKVRLRYGTFDPLVHQPAVPHDLRSRADNELLLVQFVGTPLEEMRDEIRSMGGIIERFMTDNTHIVRLPGEARGRIEVLPYVRWVGDFHPAYRVDEEILARVALGGRGEDIAIHYSIECMRSGLAHQQVVADFITSIGGFVERTASMTRRMEAALTLEQAVALAHRNDVAFIEPRGVPGLDMNLARQSGGAVPLLSGLGITGQGVRGEVIDSGIDMNSGEWNGNTPLLHGLVDGELVSHGTNVYGINFATGVVTPEVTGFMPNHERGVFGHYRIFLTSGPHNVSRVAYDLESVDPNGPYRVVFQNNSWGEMNTLYYDTFSAERDDAIFQARLLVTQSQGNNGNQQARGEAWAKNVVAIGGIWHGNSLDRTTHARSGASFGPASDLRTKPDLAHFYDNIHTVYSTSFGGTSAAAPLTSGHFGLLFQMWHEGVFPGKGGGATVFESRPDYTLAKAMAFATAYRYETLLNTSGFQDVRNIQGWGMIDLTKPYELRERSFLVDADEHISNAQTIAYEIDVDLDEPELLVSLVWNDPPGTPGAAQARINDLDLKVTSPGGAVYWGNYGLRDGNWSLPGGVPNTVDTAENVFVQNPEHGTWTVEVIGSQVVQNTVPGAPGIQADFGLAVFGGVLGPPPPLRMSFPGGLPAMIPPEQAHQATVKIVAATQNIVPGSPALHFRPNSSSSFSTLPLAHIGGDEYEVEIPGFACGSMPEIYFSVEGHQGAVVRLPRNAPDEVFATQAAVIVPDPLMEVNFETAWPTGWSATGLWNVNSSCAPAGNSCAPGPHAYYGRPTTCTYFLPTGPSSGILSAPEVNLPAVPTGGGVSLKFCYALQTEGHPSLDKAELFVNGATRSEWRLPDVAPTPAEPDRYWAEAEFDLTEFAGSAVTLSWRFDTVTGSNNAFRGWHVDNIRVVASVAGCEAVCYANCDRSTMEPILTVDDFTCFINEFAAAQGLPHEQQIDHYANCDGSTIAPVLTVDDFTCFINAFAAGCR